MGLSRGRLGRLLESTRVRSRSDDWLIDRRTEAERQSNYGGPESRPNDARPRALARFGVSLNADPFKERATPKRQSTYKVGEIRLEYKLELKQKRKNRKKQ